MHYLYKKRSRNTALAQYEVMNAWGTQTVLTLISVYEECHLCELLASSCMDMALCSPSCCLTCSGEGYEKALTAPDRSVTTECYNAVMTHTRLKISLHAQGMGRVRRGMVSSHPSLPCKGNLHVPAQQQLINRSVKG